MVNEIRDDNQQLVPVNYTELLTQIITVLQDQNTKTPFQLSSDGKRLIIKLSAIAQSVATASIDNPLGNQSKQAKVATVNFRSESKQKFTEQIQQIRDSLTPYLETALPYQNASSIPDWVNQIATQLTNFTGKCGNYVSLDYPFQQQESGLQKTKLTLTPNHQSQIRLQFHKLKISIEKTHQFRSLLENSLRNYIELQFSEDEQAELKEILDDLVNYEQSDFHRLERLIDQEALGKIQREAKVIYLEFIKEQIDHHPHLIYLEDLIRRLRLLEDYINDEEKEDGHYQVNYHGITINYRDLFSRADAFDMLPIIPLVEGCLGETEDHKNDKKQFIFGLKLKLNGLVQGGKDAFHYYLELLDPESESHKQGLEDSYSQKFFVEKILKLALLYYFVFAVNDLSQADPKAELSYNPITNFEAKVLPILQAEDESQKQNILRGIKAGLEKYQAHDKVKKLKALLVSFIQNKRHLPARNYPRHLNIKQGILEKDYQTISNHNSFFHTLQDNPKLALQYISITDPNAGNTSLASLTVNINISEVTYFTAGESDTFTMGYHVGKIPTIPILLTPEDTLSREVYKQKLNQGNLLIFSYDVKQLQNAILETKSSAERYFYKVSFSLLVYVTLKLLFDSSGKRFFIPIMRLHLGDENNPHPEEKFLKSVFSTVSHLLKEEHQSNTQGFRLKDIQTIKMRNALTSLYSVLPKTFEFNRPSANYELDKLAIIIVSSRESDRVKDSSIKSKISNLIGEAIGMYRQPNNQICLYTSGTFSDNYGREEIYHSPSAIIDEVNKLYDQGFRHFLYLAKSPYSSKLNIVAREDEEELFFMSKSVIRSLQGDKQDIIIYPVFFDQYYAVNLETDQPKSSLYIQESMELSNLTEDPAKKTCVFLNLFNGIKVGSERYYNGVISYATLLNIYDDSLDEEIRKGLIDETPLKKEIVEFLTLFHFSRYESKTKINLKLNPYQSIIGEESISALSMFDHIIGKTQFNSLAFLTEVKKALNVKQVRD